MNGGWGISYEIALRWMPLNLSDYKSTLVRVMAWCRQAANHYLSQCWPRSTLPNGITRPQWVKRQQPDCKAVHRALTCIKKLFSPVRYKHLWLSFRHMYIPISIHILVSYSPVFEWISSIISCSVLILASDWLTAVKYGAVSHVWRHQREI